MHTISGLAHAVLSVGAWWLVTVAGVAIIVAAYGLFVVAPVRLVNGYRFRHGHR